MSKVKVTTTTCVPIRSSYVKNYYERIYGNPVELPFGHELKHMLTILLMKPPKRSLPDITGDYPHQLSFSISKHVFHNNGFSLGIKSIFILNAKLESEIKNLIITAIDKYIATGYKQKEAFDLALEELELSEDILTFDAVKQFYYRRRQNTKRKART